MLMLISGSIVFLGAHSISIVAPGWRDRMAARLGIPASNAGGRRQIAFMSILPSKVANLSLGRRQPLLSEFPN